MGEKTMTTREPHESSRREGRDSHGRRPHSSSRSRRDDPRYQSAAPPSDSRSNYDLVWIRMLTWRHRGPFLRLAISYKITRFVSLSIISGIALVAQGEGEMTGGMNRIGRTTEVEMKNLRRCRIVIRSGTEMLSSAMILRMLSRNQ